MDHPWIRVSRDNPFQAATSQSAREHSGGSTHFQFLRARIFRKNSRWSSPLHFGATRERILSEIFLLGSCDHTLTENFQPQSKGVT